MMIKKDFLLFLAFLFSLSLFSCNDTLEITNVTHINVSNPSSDYESYSNFIIVNGNGFNKDATININFEGMKDDEENLVNYSPLKIDSGNSLMSVIVPSGVPDGVITVTIGETFVNSDAISYSATEAITDSIDPTIILNWIITGSSIGIYDVNFTVTDDTAIMGISTGESLVAGLSTGIWPSGSFDLSDVTIVGYENEDGQTVAKLTVIDIAGHTAASNEYPLP